MDEIEGMTLAGREVLAELQAIRRQQVAQTEALRDLCGLLRAHAEGKAVGADAGLVHAIHEAFAGHEFSGGELLQRAQRDDPLGRLLAALTIGMGRRHVGIRLGQLAGMPTAGGLVLVQTSDNREGAVWQVRVWGLQDSQLGQPAGRGHP